MVMFIKIASTFLLAFLVIGLAMLFRVKARSEKIMVTQFLSALSIAWLLLQVEIAGSPHFYDAGLLFALLATLITVAFVSYVGNEKEEKENDESP